jgi:hypothetical protein
MTPQPQPHAKFSELQGGLVHGSPVLSKSASKATDDGPITVVSGNKRTLSQTASNVVVDHALLPPVPDSVWTRLGRMKVRESNVAAVFSVQQLEHPADVM